MYIQGLVIFLFSIFLYLFYNLLKRKISNEENKLFHKKINNFDSYLSVLEYYMNTSYDIIYKDRVMVYSLEATKIPDNELEPIVKDFISLTIKFLGPRLTNEFIHFYGNEETFYFIVGQTFYLKYENDKIRESSTSNLMDYEIS